MSIVLSIVRVLLLFAVLNFAVKARTGSFLDNSDLVAWQNGRDTSGKADGR